MSPFFFVAGFVDRLGEPFIRLAFFRFVLMRMEFRVKPGIASWHGMDNIFGTMTALVELDLKQRLALLSVRDRRAMSAYLLRLKHQSNSGRQGISKLMKEMDAGRKTGLSKLATDLGHG